MNNPMADRNLKMAVPFFMVANIDKSISFYKNGLGFEMKFDWKPNGRIEWCWLERDGVALMLQEYRKEFLPKEKLGQGVSICVVCKKESQPPSRLWEIICGSFHCEIPMAMRWTLKAAPTYQRKQNTRIGKTAFKPNALANVAIITICHYIH
ncbi:MAG: VOC family protein [Bacteroidota bacterium]